MVARSARSPWSEGAIQVPWVVLSDCPPKASPLAPCPARIGQTTTTGAVTNLQTVPVAGANLVGTPASTVAVFATRDAVFATRDKVGAQLLTTLDSGRTWSRHRDPCTLGGGSLAGTDPRQWWLLCAQDTGMNHDIVDIYETRDSGVSWTRKAAAKPYRRSAGGLGDETPQRFAISPDGRRLWIVGVNLVQTSPDGGQTWTRAPGVHIAGALASLDSLPAERAWIAAANQGLWATADGSLWNALGPTGIPDS